jgi:Tfp pilus assembly protein PilF
MGLGNSFWALRKLTRAETAFREASRLHPTSGAAFNNLAQVLWEQGRQGEALRAVQRAVALGGP